MDKCANRTEVTCVTHVAQMLQPEDVLQVTVSGDCMFPFLQHGQRVTLRKQVRYLPGDIIAFAGLDGTPLVHRYLGPAPGRRVMTCADASNRIDVLVPLTQVLGKVVQCDREPVKVSLVRRLQTIFSYICWYGRLGLARVIALLHL